MSSKLKSKTPVEQPRLVRLLPCPFCGSDPIYNHFSNHKNPNIDLQCSNPQCSVTFGPAYLDSDTVAERCERERMLAKLWNRRVKPSETSALLILLRITNPP